MALSKSIITESGIELPNAYIRITDFNLNYLNKFAVISVCTYKDEDARFNNMQPMSQKVYRLFNGFEVPSIQASYNIQLAELLTNQNLLISFDGTQFDINIIEGVNFTASSVLTGNISIICSVLMSKEIFNKNWIADGKGEQLIITAKKGRNFDGTAGNMLQIGGTIAVKQEQFVIGEDKIPGDFDQFFSVEALNYINTNIISQGYAYLKTLPEFEGYIDVL